MTDPSQIGLDQYMNPIDSPIAGTTTWRNFQINDSRVGATAFGVGRINVPLTIGGIQGGAYVKIDGPNNRIVVNDGTTNRIVIGSV